MTNDVRHSCYGGSHLNCLFSSTGFCLYNYVEAFRKQMSRLMIKPTKWLYAQWRLRSAWGSAQSDQRLRCAPMGSLEYKLSSCRHDLSLCWTHMPFCWFCYEPAQMMFVSYKTILGNHSFCFCGMNLLRVLSKFSTKFESVRTFENESKLSDTVESRQSTQLNKWC